MDVCFITPTPMLNLFAVKSRTHLVLAHIYEVDEAYRNFYKERVAAGDFVILDNSAYELQESVAVERLYKCALDLNPSAIFLPDCRFNTERTIALAIEAHEVLGGHGWKLLGVPQGSNLKEILQCYHWMLGRSWIAGFGLYEEIGDVAGLGTRAAFLQYLEENSGVVDGKYYHLLGMEEDMTALKKLATYKWVNSIDSAKPIVYGLAAIPLAEDCTKEKYPHRPEGYFGIDAPEYYPCINHNIEQTLQWVKQ